MSESPQAKLESFIPRHDCFVGIDSDGSVFPTMDIKQKQCIIPVTVEHWGLQEISPYVWETAEFVSLRSIWRGSNRFQVLAKVFDLCRERPEIERSGVIVPDLTSLKELAAAGVALSHPGIKKVVDETGDPVLASALEWNEKVNAAIAEKVTEVEPFPHARESVDKVSARADVIVISTSPSETLEREWTAQGMAGLVAMIAGQEMGSKPDQLRRAVDGRYAAGRVLMIGDAIGDLDAAETVGAAFYPINPGGEEESWHRFLNEAADRFFAGTYTGDYQHQLIQGFKQLLPDTPPWKERGGL